MIGASHKDAQCQLSSSREHEAVATRRPDGVQKGLRMRVLLLSLANVVKLPQVRERLWPRGEKNVVDRACLTQSGSDGLHRKKSTQESIHVQQYAHSSKEDLQAGPWRQGKSSYKRRAMPRPSTRCGTFEYISRVLFDPEDTWSRGALVSKIRCGHTMQTRRKN